MTTMHDSRNNKQVNLHHKGKDRFEITAGKDQAVLTDEQVKALAERIMKYMESDK